MMRVLFLFNFFLITAVAHAQPIELVTQEKTFGTITELTFSPDSRYVASVGNKRNIIKIWHINSQKMVGALTGHKEKIKALAFSPKGNRLISADEKGKVIHWSLDTWAVVDSLQTKRKVEFSNAAYGKNTILLGSESGSVYTYKNNAVKEKTGLWRGVTEMVYSSAQDSFLAADEKGKVALYDGSGKQKWEERVLRDKVVMLSFLSDKNIVGDEDGDIVYFDNQGEELSDFEIDSKKILQMGAAGQRLVFSTKNQALHILDLQEQKELKVFNEETEGDNPHTKITNDIEALDLSEDGSFIATAAFNTNIFGKVKTKHNQIKLWDARRLSYFGKLEGAVNPQKAFAFNAKNNHLVILGEERSVTFWNLNRAELIFRDTLPPPKIEKKPVEVEEEDVKETKDDIKDAISGDLSGLFDGGNDNKVEKALVSTMKRSFTKKTLLRFSPDGKYLFTRTPQDELRRYQVQGDSLIGGDAFFHKLSNLNTITFTPDGKYIACGGSGDEAVAIMDVASGDLVETLSTKGPEGKLNYFFEAKSLAFSPDGSQLAVAFNTGKLYVFDTDSWSQAFENALPGSVGITKGAYANYTPDGEKLIVSTVGGLKVFDPKSFEVFGEKQLSIEGTPIAMDAPSNVAVTLKDNKVNFENIATDSTYSYAPINKKWVNDVGMSRNGLLGMSLRNGSFIFLNPENGQEVVTFVGEGDDYIFKTKDNYYKVTKEGFDLVTFRIGNEAYPFEQFDVRLNRPDIVLETLGCEDQKLIKMYHKAYEKRIEKLGYEESDFEGEIQLPDVAITNKNNIPVGTENPEITIDIQASSKKYPLEKMHVWVNNVPVSGKDGQKISGQSIDTSLSVMLTNGFNKVEVGAFDTKGNESIRDVVEVDVKGEEKGDLYLITIGTSKYQDERFNLSYAAKDARDLSDLFKGSSNSSYDKILRKTLTNKEVVKDNFKALKDFLNQTSVNDKVIVFIAGHGVLNADFDYFYGTHDMNFQNPEGKGLSYGEIESILNGIAANKKLLIMDTCHSGEVDKDEVEKTESKNVVEGDIAFRSAGPAIKQSEVSPSKMMRELFNDVRRGTGAIVISSAGGAEYAMESGEYKNGLFTYVLLLGLRSGKADLNADGKIMLSELQEYIVDRVSKLSNGKQVPNTRVQNVAQDYVVW